MKIRNLQELNGAELNSLLNRFGEDFSSLMIDTVIPIVQHVRRDGDDAVRHYTRKFDRIDLPSILVDENEIEQCEKKVPRGVIDAFAAARKNIEEFHLKQKRDIIRYTRGDGTTLGVMYHPLERAAVYVPGGKAAYPSSVLMGVIPAQVAGVENITVITPPGPDGTVNPVVLAMCRMLGVKSIVKSGGAQGIAAAGLGTESVVKSDIIVGPGNIYVTAAKTYLFSLGMIQIDSMAGPSEVLIIADESANPEWVACDLLSQAEHEEMAIALLVTPSPELAAAVSDAVARDLERGTGRSEIKRKAIGDNGLILLTGSIGEAIDFSNRYGPEHMELMVDNSLEYLPIIRNVGSLFLGHHSPVAAGDYFSGTNHILPTGGAARFSSGLSVETFLRRTTFQHLSREALKKACAPIGVMSRVEGFEDKHGASVALRFDGEDR